MIGMLLEEVLVEAICRVTGLPQFVVRPVVNLAIRLGEPTINDLVKYSVGSLGLSPSVADEVLEELETYELQYTCPFSGETAYAALEIASPGEGLNCNDCDSELVVSVDKTWHLLHAVGFDETDVGELEYVCFSKNRASTVVDDDAEYKCGACEQKLLLEGGALFHELDCEVIEVDSEDEPELVEV